MPDQDMITYINVSRSTSPEEVLRAPLASFPWAWPRIPEVISRAYRYPRVPAASVFVHGAGLPVLRGPHAHGPQSERGITVQWHGFDVCDVSLHAFERVDVVWLPDRYGDLHGRFTLRPMWSIEVTNTHYGTEDTMLYTCFRDAMLGLIDTLDLRG